MGVQKARPSILRTCYYRPHPIYALASSDGLMIVRLTSQYNELQTLPFYRQILSPTIPSAGDVASNSKPHSPHHCSISLGQPSHSSTAFLHSSVSKRQRSQCRNQCCSGRDLGLGHFRFLLVNLPGSALLTYPKRQGSGTSLREWIPPNGGASWTQPILQERGQPP